MKTYQNILISILWIFPICYTAKASVNDTTNYEIVITAIVKDYKGSDSLINHSKKLTKLLISSWDSVQTFNHTLILDTLNEGNHTKNLYRAIIRSEDNIHEQEIQETQVRYSVTLENTVNGEVFDELTFQSSPDFFFNYSEKLLDVRLMNLGLINNLTETNNLLSNSNQFRNDSTLTFAIRSIDFDKVSFSERQKNYLTNLVNNVMVSRENGYNRYNKKTEFLRKKLNFLTIVDDGNMREADFVLDISFTENKEKNIILLSFDVSGRSEANLLVPEKLDTWVAFDRKKFLDGETLESNTKIGNKLFGFIAYQFFLY
ncbi:hypothetical protein [Albibacterium indicum]|uniref:hypothetical protein n=1 Tax=Albibacterium indicum TaxID=2292082 RepID=UPI000E52E556|nr:hypothetical protein [Pedobacter indicus]